MAQQHSYPRGTTFTPEQARAAGLDIEVHGSVDATEAVIRALDGRHYTIKSILADDMIDTGVLSRVQIQLKPSARLLEAILGYDGPAPRNETPPEPELISGFSDDRAASDHTHS